MREKYDQPQRQDFINQNVNTQNLYNCTWYTPSPNAVAKPYCLALDALRFDKVLSRQGKATFSSI